MTSVAWHSRKGISNLDVNQSKDFFAEYTEKRKGNPDALLWDDVIHYVIIPNYKESTSILQETLNSLAASKIATTHIIVVLAMEEREAQCEQKAQLLIGRYASMFREVLYTVHPADLPFERAGKSSNEAWAAVKVQEHIQKSRFDSTHVVLTICDADSNFSPKYFECLTDKFCHDPSRYCKIWQSPMVCYKNFSTIPAFTRILSMFSTLNELGSLASPLDHHMPFSSYSLSFQLASQAGGWDGDVIAEDWHMYLKTYFATNGKVIVEPIFLMTTCYSVQSSVSYWQSLVDRFEQAKRHAWGMTELSYFVSKLSSTSNLSSLLRTATLGWRIFSVHYFAVIGVLHVVLASLLTMWYTKIPSLADSPVTLTITEIWSPIIKLFSLLVLVPTVIGMWGHVRLVRIVQKDSIPWYTLLQWLILDWFVFGLIANVVFTCIPTIWAASRVLFTDEIRYVVASRPTTIDNDMDTEQPTVDDKKEESV
jgi:hypothetical protein